MTSTEMLTTPSRSQFFAPPQNWLRGLGRSILATLAIAKHCRALPYGVHLWKLINDVEPLWRKTKICRIYSVCGNV